MKRTLPLLLAMLLVLSATAASAATLTESGYPITTEPMTMRMFAPYASNQGPWEEMSLFTFMEELTGIHWEFELVPSASYTEKKNLSFAGGDLPDVFFAGDLTTAEEVNYGAQGLLIPLNDLIDDYAPNLQYLFETTPGLRKAITADDGNIYALFYRSGTPRGSQYCYWVNANWMDALGVAREDLPKTLDELYALCLRFRDEDPNGNGQADERPISGGIANFRALVMNAYGAIFNGNGFYADEDGKVVYQFTLDTYRDYLDFAHKCFVEKLLDQDIFTQTGEQRRANGMDNKLGILDSQLPTTIFAIAPDGQDITRYPFLPTLVGGENTTPVKNAINAVTRGRFAITSKCPSPEAAIRWIDYIYSYDGSMMMWQGAENEAYAYVDDTRTTWKQLLPEGMSSEEFRRLHTPSAGIGTPFYIYPGMLEGLTNVDELYSNAEARAHMDELKEAYPLVYNTELETEELSILSTDVKTYLDETEAQFITGRLPLTDENWEKYVNTVNNMGAIQMTDIYQAAYDRYLAK